MKTILPTSLFAEARRNYHVALLRGPLSTNEKGVPSIADKGSKTSIRIADELVARVGSASVSSPLAVGGGFEDATWHYVSETFPRLNHLRPGRWEV